MQALRQAIELLGASSHTAALTGAGISTPSGIPDFRSERHGLWQLADPLEVASLWGFHERPERFYTWFRPLLARSLVATPNPAHRALAQMEQVGWLETVITQNIDSLHQRAGSRQVLELHGHTRTATCLDCGQTIAAEPLLSAILNHRPAPPCPSCGGLLKPDVVLFGEPLSYDMISAAQRVALSCEVLLVIGTSLEVMPAADLPLLARRRGARVIMVNLSPTPLDDQMDVVIRADVAKTMQWIWRTLAHED